MRKILFIMVVCCTFGISSAMAEQWDPPMNCGCTDCDLNGKITCNIDHCASPGVDCVGNNTVCLCNQCESGYHLVASAVGGDTCLPAPAPHCKDSLCNCCYTPGTDAACLPDAVSHVITTGCSAKVDADATCMLNNSIVNTNDFCAGIVDDPQRYCDIGYYGLTANSASGTCTQCPEFTSPAIWTDSGHNTYARGTTTEYLGVGSTSADCCLPKLQSGQYYYDATGRFTNNAD